MNIQPEGWAASRVQLNGWSITTSMHCSDCSPVLPALASLQKFPHIQCFAMPHLVAVCISVFTSLLAMGAWAAAADGAPLLLCALLFHQRQPASMPGLRVRHLERPATTWCRLPFLRLLPNTTTTHPLPPPTRSHGLLCVRRQQRAQPAEARALGTGAPQVGGCACLLWHAWLRQQLQGGVPHRAVVGSTLTQFHTHLAAHSPYRSSVKRFFLISIITLINEMFPSYTKLQACRGRWGQEVAWQCRAPVAGQLSWHGHAANHTPHLPLPSCRAWCASLFAST